MSVVSITLDDGRILSFSSNNKKITRDNLIFDSALDNISRQYVETNLDIEEENIANNDYNNVLRYLFGEIDVINNINIIKKILENGVYILSDEESLQLKYVHRTWSENIEYKANDRVLFGDILFKCLQNHTSQDQWNPVIAPSLWAKVLIPNENIIPEWEQPNSTNPYSQGDKVSHNGNIWISDANNNIWEPGVYGWSVFENN